jgi:hypothetical protein
MFGTQNKSKVSEALEDFVRHSLDPLETTWERLLFTFRLKKTTEHYKHWGMEHTYGKDIAREALCRAHLNVVKNLLGTNLATTLCDLEAYAEKMKMGSDRAAAVLRSDPKSLPSSLSLPEAAHLAVELETLRILTKR